MIIWQEKKPTDEEKQKLYEMSIRVILRPEEGFPFTICVMDPETEHKNDPHAHLFEPNARSKDLKMRLALSPEIPRSVFDIRDAFPGQKKYHPIPEEWKLLIFDWVKRPNKVDRSITNWSNLWLQWCYSVN
jgi:hypothetical protein